MVNSVSPISTRTIWSFNALHNRRLSGVMLSRAMSQLRFEWINACIVQRVISRRQQDSMKTTGRSHWILRVNKGRFNWWPHKHFAMDRLHRSALMMFSSEMYGSVLVNRTWNSLSRGCSMLLSRLRTLENIPKWDYSPSHGRSRENSKKNYWASVWTGQWLHQQVWVVPLRRQSVGSTGAWFIPNFQINRQLASFMHHGVEQILNTGRHHGSSKNAIFPGNSIQNIFESNPSSLQRIRLSIEGMSTQRYRLESHWIIRFYTMPWFTRWQAWWSKERFGIKVGNHPAFEPVSNTIFLRWSKCRTQSWWVSMHLSENDWILATRMAKSNTSDHKSIISFWIRSSNKRASPFIYPLWSMHLFSYQQTKQLAKPSVDFLGFAGTKPLTLDTFRIICQRTCSWQRRWICVTTKDG